MTVIKSDGGVQKKPNDEVFDKLKVFEEGMKEFLSDGRSFVGGEYIGFLDIVMCPFYSAHKAHEEVLGVKFIDQDKYPLVFFWVAALKKLAAEKGIQLCFIALIGHALEGFTSFEPPLYGIELFDQWRTYELSPGFFTNVLQLFYNKRNCFLTTATNQQSNPKRESNKVVSKPPESTFIFIQRLRLKFQYDRKFSPLAHAFP